MTLRVRTMIQRTSFILIGLALAPLGCVKKVPVATPSVTDVPTVRLVKPETRDLVRSVGQPSFIDSYEQTAIYAKLPAYVLKWNVDIGDRIKKDELLATLFIPELEQEYNLKKATVSMDQALIAQAHKLVDVADGNLKAAVAKVAETQADVGKFEALVKRWDSEVDRQHAMVAERVLDQQILGESRRQLESSRASKDAAEAAVKTAEALQLARGADLEKAKVDVDVAHGPAEGRRSRRKTRRRHFTDTHASWHPTKASSCCATPIRATLCCRPPAIRRRLVARPIKRPVAPRRSTSWPGRTSCESMSTCPNPRRITSSARSIRKLATPVP